MKAHFVAHCHSGIRLTRMAVLIMGFMFSACCGAAVLTGTLIEGSPDNYNLTTLNETAGSTVLDWRIWGEGASSLSPTDSKLDGGGIGELTTVGYAPTLRYLSQFGDFGQASFQWSDGTPNASSANVFAGIQYCDVNGTVGAVGSGFSLSLTGEAGVSRQVDIWMGTHRGTTRVEASLSGADSVFYDLSHNTGNKFGWATFTFTPDSNDDVLTITSTFITPADASKLGNSYFFAAALSEETSAVPEPGSAFIMLIGIGMLLLCRSKITVRKCGSESE